MLSWLYDITNTFDLHQYINACSWIHTNKKNGERDKEEKHMWDEVKCVHEAAIVQNSIVHAVGVAIFVVSAERQAHVYWSGLRSLGMMKNKNRQSGVFLGGFLMLNAVFINKKVSMLFNSQLSSTWNLQNFCFKPKLKVTKAVLLWLYWLIKYLTTLILWPQSV